MSTLSAFVTWLAGPIRAASGGGAPMFAVLLLLGSLIFFTGWNLIYLGNPFDELSFAGAGGFLLGVGRVARAPRAPGAGGEP